jgi:hypothetical protein
VFYQEVGARCSTTSHGPLTILMPTPPQDIFVGYRHFDRSRTKPRFPFGHGLSYTTFEYADLEVPAVVDLSSGDKARFAVRFTVKNTASAARCLGRSRSSRALLSRTSNLGRASR